MGTLHHQPDKDFIALSISSYVSFVKLPEGNLTHPYMNLEGLPGDPYPHFLHEIPWTSPCEGARGSAALLSIQGPLGESQKPGRMGAPKSLVKCDFPSPRVI